MHTALPPPAQAVLVPATPLLAMALPPLAPVVSDLALPVMARPMLALMTLTLPTRPTRESTLTVAAWTTHLVHTALRLLAPVASALATPLLATALPPPEPAAWAPATPLQDTAQLTPAPMTPTSPTRPTQELTLTVAVWTTLLVHTPPPLVPAVSAPPAALTLPTPQTVSTPT